MPGTRLTAFFLASFRVSPLPFTGSGGEVTVVLVVTSGVLQPTVMNNPETRTKRKKADINFFILSVLFSQNEIEQQRHAEHEQEGVGLQITGLHEAQRASA